MAFLIAKIFPQTSSAADGSSGTAPLRGLTAVHMSDSAKKDGCKILYKCTTVIRGQQACGKRVFIIIYA